MLRRVLTLALLTTPSLAFGQATQVPFIPIQLDEQATATFSSSGTLEGARPYLIVNGDAFALPQQCWPRVFGGDEEGRRFGGDEEGRRFGGEDEGRRFGGDEEGRRFGGDEEGRRFGGDDEGRRFGGDDEGRRFGGDDEGRRFGGDDEGRRFGGDEEGRRFGGDEEGRRFGGDDEGRRFGGDAGQLGCRMLGNGTVIEFNPHRESYVLSRGQRYDVVGGILRF